MTPAVEIQRRRRIGFQRAGNNAAIDQALVMLA
jgi:hypothetical protein